MNLQKVKTVTDCEQYHQALKLELDSRIRNNDGGRRMLRREIEAVAGLITAMKSPELFHQHYQFVPI
jgi:hypothetical protein